MSMYPKLDYPDDGSAGIADSALLDQLKRAHYRGGIIGSKSGREYEVRVNDSMGDPALWHLEINVRGEWRTLG